MRSPHPVTFNYYSESVEVRIVIERRNPGRRFIFGLQTSFSRPQAPPDAPPPMRSPAWSPGQANRRPLRAPRAGAAPRRPSARSNTAIWRWALVPRAMISRACSTSSRQSKWAASSLDQCQDLFEQLGVGDNRSLAEIDQPTVDAVALRPPAVLVDQHAGVEPPALVLPLQPPQHAQQAAEKGGDRQANCQVSCSCR